MRILLLLACGFCLRAQPQVEELHQVYQEYFEFTLRESPEFATLTGRTEYNDRWTDYSPVAHERRKAAYQSFRARAGRRAAASLPASERMSHRVFLNLLERTLESMDEETYFMAVNHYRGPTRLVAQTIDSAPGRTVKDLEDQISRLRAMGAMVDTIMAAANEGLRRKLQAPRRTAELLVPLLDAGIKEETSKTPLLKAFRQMPPSIPAGDRQRLSHEAAKAYEESFRPAWRKFRDYVSNTYIPRTRTSLGVSQNFNGAELYQSFIRTHTTTRLTAREIHDIGLREMERIQKEMSAIRTSTGFSGTAEEFERKVLSAPHLLFHSEEEILAHGRDIAKRIDPLLPALFLKLPRMPYGVEAIPSAIARTAAPFYRPPSLDGKRAGYFYLRTVDPEKQSRCCMESLILHEAVPGHHLQLALAVEMENVPEFRKVSRYTAFAEGWGLYAESLGEELGMYRNPFERYGRLQGEVMRAARLVVDTGVHALGWSREQMIAAMAPGKGGWLNDDFISSEVDRYIAQPGQALAYKIGGLRLQELRRKAEQALGAKFDVRAFHDVVLRNGALPLDILTEEVDGYIASTNR